MLRLIWLVILSSSHLKSTWRWPMIFYTSLEARHEFLAEKYVPCFRHHAPAQHKILGTYVLLPVIPETFSSLIFLWLNMNLNTVESRFVEPSISQTSRYSNQFLSSFPWLLLCNFTLDFSKLPVSRTNSRSPWKFEKMGFYCIWNNESYNWTANEKRIHVQLAIIFQFFFS